MKGSCYQVFIELWHLGTRNIFDKIIAGNTLKPSKRKSKEREAKQESDTQYGDSSSNYDLLWLRELPLASMSDLRTAVSECRQLVHSIQDSQPANASSYAMIVSIVREFFVEIVPFPPSDLYETATNLEDENDSFPRPTVAFRDDEDKERQEALWRGDGSKGTKTKLEQIQQHIGELAETYCFCVLALDAISNDTARDNSLDDGLCAAANKRACSDHAVTMAAIVAIFLSVIRQEPSDEMSVLQRVFSGRNKDKIVFGSPQSGIFGADFVSVEINNHEIVLILLCE